MTIPAGRGSVKLREDFSTSSLLSMVNVRVLVPPGGIVSGEKALLNPGRASDTVKVAVAELPEAPTPPIVPMRLIGGFIAVMVPATLTLAVHVSRSAPSVPPENVMVVPPSGALRVALVQSVKALAGVAIVIPDGRVSVNARSDAGVDSGFVRVKVRVLVLALGGVPEPIVDGEKALEKVRLKPFPIGLETPCAFTDPSSANVG